MPELPKSESKPKRPWLWLLIISLVGPAVGGVIFIVVLVILLASFSGGTFSKGRAVDEEPDLAETWSCGHGETKVVRIPVVGVLFEDGEQGFLGQQGPVESALVRIQAATVDPDVRAIILEINSPGGGVTASDQIYNALLKFKGDDPERKIVAIMGDIAASGGYYIAAAADYIIANPTTITGSLSVLISSLNVKELGDKMGVKMVTIKSGENKDMLGLFSEGPTEVQRALLQAVVDEMHERFVSVIAAGRKQMTKEEIAAIADGQVLSAAKALNCKLIDAVGYWDDAVDQTCEMLGVDDIKVVRYDDKLSVFSLLTGAVAERISPRSVVEAAQPRMLYLWQAW